jgi:AraC-like DNA-binding protein/mannose-6-phosphate isomerase-like protein (cupin superfamily)
VSGIAPRRTRLDPVFGQFQVNDGELSEESPITPCHAKSTTPHLAFRAGALPIHAVYAEACWTVGAHVHQGYCEVALVVAGEAIQVIDTAAVPTSKGDILFLRDGVVHAIMQPALPLCQVVVSFAPAQLRRQTDLILEPFYDAAHEYKIHPNDEDFGWIAAQFLGLVHVGQMSAGRREPMERAQLDALVRTLLAQYDGPSNAGELTRARYLRQVERHVMTRLRDKICVEDLAAVFGRRPADFSRDFVGKTGMRPTDCVNQVRVAEARRLLEQSDRSITEILYESGFRNSTHFNKVFRRMVGRAPGEHRALVRARQAG